MRRIHLPVWLDSASKPRAAAFVVLFSLEAWCRALLLTIIPLEALRMMGDAQSVSVLYFTVSIAGLASTMVIPLLVHIARRRWVFTLGVGMMLAAVAAYWLGSPWWFAVGLGCQFIATAIFEIVINLYVLDHVPKTEISKFEPRRLLFVAAPFTFGPWLGVWMFENIDPVVTYGAVGFCAFAMLVFFWFLRISDNPAVTSPLKPPPNPLRYLPRFFRQPRLAVAWGLAIGRTGWWMMFFVYGPIFLTQSGYSKDTAALIISVGVLPMFLATVWGAIGRKKGIRYLLMLGYGVTAVLSIGIAVVQGSPTIAAVLIVMAAFAASMIDGAGNIPFLRAVHPYERSEMTSVFVTFRQTSQLITPGVFAIVLSTFALPAVFVAAGIGAGAMTLLARNIPKRL